MHFNTALTGLGDEATLVFRNAVLSLSELRYAIDAAMLSSIPDELVGLLEAQGIVLDIGVYDAEHQWHAKRNHAWFQQGVSCEIIQPHMVKPQQGKLKFRVHLEFCPDEADQVVANEANQTIDLPPAVEVLQKVEVPQKVGVTHF